MSSVSPSRKKRFPILLHEAITAGDNEMIVLSATIMITGEATNIARKEGSLLCDTPYLARITLHSLHRLILILFSAAALSDSQVFTLHNLA